MNAGNNDMIAQDQEQELVQPFAYSDNELAVLAESFFHHRGDGLGAVEDWWNSGHL
jgi:hypothetical protein